MTTIRHGVATCLVAVCASIGATSVHADSEVTALAIASVAIVATAIGTPTEKESDHVAFEVGGFDVIKNVDPATAFGIEYRAGQTLLWKLRPFVGAGYTTKHSFYGYGGIRVAANWGDHVVATPSFAIEGYSRGDGKDLGTPAVLGRFGIDLEYRFDDDVRVGVAYHHMSNGKVLGQTVNPGTEVVGVTLSLPLH